MGAAALAAAATALVAPHGRARSSSQRGRAQLLRAQSELKPGRLAEKLREAKIADAMSTRQHNTIDEVIPGLTQLCEILFIPDYFDEMEKWIKEERAVGEKNSNDRKFTELREVVHGL